MKLGPYTPAPEGLLTLAAGVADAWRLKYFGIPKVPGETPEEIAKAVLRRNARRVLRAGTGHFWPMWPADFGKTLIGAEHALPPEYLGGLIERMIVDSETLGRVPTCFSAFRGFDMPWPRADGLPWLVYSVHEHRRWTGDSSLLDRRRASIQSLLDRFETETFAEGLVSRKVTGDWMDTIRRPSSTYNNLCVLNMLRLAREMGLETRHDPHILEVRLLENRWRTDHFIDYAGTERLSVDSAVLALYFELLDDERRELAIEKLEASEFLKPYPILSSPEPYPSELNSPLAKLGPSNYHSIVWLHLGAMYLNGLKKAGRDVSARRKQLGDLISSHHNCLETLDLDGKPFWTPVFATEHGLSMAAGQYLELALT